MATRTGRRKITLKNVSGQTIKVKGEVIKNNEERNLGRFECRENHKFDINDEHGKDLLTKQIHLRKRAKHLIFSKTPEGHFALYKMDKSGKPKTNSDINEDDPDDLVDEEDKQDEKADDQTAAPPAAGGPVPAGDKEKHAAQAGQQAQHAAGTAPS